MQAPRADRRIVPYTAGMMKLSLGSLAMLTLIGAPAGADPDPSPAAPVKEMFPGIRVDVAARTIEFEGMVPIRVDDARAPRVYLEQVACIPETKEHEVLLVTKARPSHVHAGLLAIGLMPGKPATWRDEGNRVIPVPPEGAEVSIELTYTDANGAAKTVSPRDWVVNATTGERWPTGHWVFAGSAMKKVQGSEIYAADAEGTLIGLTSFGTEVLAWPGVISPDSQQQDPEWIADAKALPPFETMVTIRLGAVE